MPQATDIANHPPELGTPADGPTDASTDGTTHGSPDGTAEGPADEPGRHPRSAAPDEIVANLAYSLQRLSRTFHRIREQYLARARHDVEKSADVLISALASGGPMRASALAECVRSDPSTISRQVAALVRDGYAERRPDPRDRRAALLALTPAGEEVFEEHRRLRQETLREVMADWSEGDLELFARLIDTYINDLESYELRTTGKEQR